MKAFCRAITKSKWVIIVACILLVIPSVIGMNATKINYDILVYLPKDIETMKGQDILTDDFNMGAFSVAIVDNMSAKQILSLEKQIRKVDGVNKVGSAYDIVGYSIPLEILPNDLVNKVRKDQSNLIVITFKNSTSDEKTLAAVRQIRKLNDKVKFSGMSATTLDTMDLSNSEIAIYIIIAVILCIIVLMLSLDSFFVPFLLLGNIGVAILFNMGTNIFLGNISYITKAISAVLQLGVTTDFSIFLYHKYEFAKQQEHESKEEAMAEAIEATMISVIGSSLTTIAGFLALCTMSLTLGTDIGVVMAKGVFFGVVCVLTLFPSLILVFDKIIDKTSHKVLLPQFTFSKNVVKKHYKIIFAIFVIGIFPAYYGQANTKIYYNLDRTLPSDLKSCIANSELQNKFNIVSPYIIMVDSDIKSSTIQKMVDKIDNVKGIDLTLSYAKLADMGINENVLSDETKSIFDDGKHQLILVNSTYKTATNALNSQIGTVNKIVKSYDKKAIVCGEGPLTKDLVTIANTDFNNVNLTSIAVIFIIMIIVLRSASLPVLLVAAIEFAIFINMGIPYYMNTTIPFVASIVIGTIQLGATIDYAILMSTKYLEERKSGMGKMEAVESAMDHSVSSIFVSGMCFFAATFGVGVYSKLEMISSLCTMISRGAIISMITVCFVVPSMLIIFDQLIIHTTTGFKALKAQEGK